MREIPELPARHVDAPPFILGKETASRLLAGEVLANGVGFPEDLIAVPERGYPHVGIERRVFGSFLVAFDQVYDAQGRVDAEMVRDRHHLEGAWARGDYVKFDGHDLLLVSRLT